MKRVHIRSYSGLYFPAFGLNTDQNNSEYGDVLGSKAFCKRFLEKEPSANRIILKNVNKYERERTSLNTRKMKEDQAIRRTVTTEKINRSCWIVCRK